MSGKLDVKLPFTMAEYERRMRRVRSAASKLGLDALLVSSPENIYYLTGYQSIVNFTYQLLVVPVDTDPFFVQRYGEKWNVLAWSWLQSMELYRDTEDPVLVTRNALQRRRLKRVGLELGSIFLRAATARRLLDAIDGISVENCSGVIERERAVKAGEEIAYVEAAARVSEAAMRAGVEAIAEGRTDRDVAAAVYGAMILAGGEYPPLPPSILTGPRTTLFHSTWNGQRIGSGDITFLELSGVVARYLAPLARTVAVGRPPSYVLDRYAVARESLESGLEAMKPGVTCGEVYERFAAPYTRMGFEIPIRVGYAVGIAFPPSWVEWEGLDLLPGNDTALEPGMVFHTPRTVRVFGDQTPFVSECVLVTETGHRVMSGMSRELFQR